MTADNPPSRSVDDPSTVAAVPLRESLRGALPRATKARDRAAVAAVRATLAAIDNAEAVDASDVTAGAIETSAAGLGAAERPRKHLTEAEIDSIVRAEIAERLTVAAEYDGLNGGSDRAATLRAEAAALTTLIDGDQPSAAT
ncbi:hypothetical protein [Nocardia crassostreae]|uniref:hypothetical protein n=1 Tax=Nocardia crassostreae TaxID=53428 RepID=UPI001FE1EBAD|nr:hypothetical protein [Nocardia crassostreae]